MVGNQRGRQADLQRYSTGTVSRGLDEWLRAGRLTIQDPQRDTRLERMADRGTIPPRTPCTRDKDLVDELIVAFENLPSNSMENEGVLRHRFDTSTVFLNRSSLRHAAVDDHSLARKRRFRRSGERRGRKKTYTTVNRIARHHACGYTCLLYVKVRRVDTRAYSKVSQWTLFARLLCVSLGFCIDNVYTVYYTCIVSSEPIAPPSETSHTTFTSTLDHSHPSNMTDITIQVPVLQHPTSSHSLVPMRCVSTGADTPNHPGGLVYAAMPLAASRSNSSNSLESRSLGPMGS